MRRLFGLTATDRKGGSCWREIMIKAVIFDLDGTLALTWGDIRDSVDELRAMYGLPPISDGLMRHAVNMVIEDIVLNVLEGRIDSSGTHAAVEQYNAIYDRRYLCKTKPYTHLPEALSALKEAGLALAVYSNKRDRYVKAIMNEIYDGGLFDALMGPDGILPKPDPMGALILAEKWGLSPSEIAYVGDSVLDVDTGRSAGMTVIAAAWGYTERSALKERGAHYVIDDPRELFPLIMKLRSES